MNKMTVNEATGFLESKSKSAVGFVADKKALFLEMARKYQAETGNIPDITPLCEAVGISLRTFERHIQADGKFADDWREILLSGEAKLSAKMFEYAQGKGGFMFMISWLRRHFPERWNPEYKITQQVNVNLISNLVDKARAIDAEEVVE